MRRAGGGREPQTHRLITRQRIASLINLVPEFIPGTREFRIVGLGHAEYRTGRARTHVLGALDAEVSPCEDASLGLFRYPGSRARRLRPCPTGSTSRNQRGVAAWGPCPMRTGSVGKRGFPNRPHAKQSVRSGSGSGGCGRLVKSKSHERSVASRSPSVKRESPQLVSMKRRTLENSPT